MDTRSRLLLPPDASRLDRMRRLAEAISPLQRMVNSPGLDLAFEMLGEHHSGMILHEYPTGAQAEDWVVPQAWMLREASMTDQAGRVIASAAECPLFVAPFSEPVDGWFSKDEIAQHLRTRPDQPEAFALEHRNAYDYRLKDWGITLPHNRWLSLPEGKYQVRIDTHVFDSTMKVGEWVLPGRSAETILLTAHIDELCNDDLSGCLVGLEIMRAASLDRNRRYTYRLVLAPEMFGTLFYAHNNPAVLGQVVGMLNLEALGAGENLCAKLSLKGDAEVDSALCAALDSLGLPYWTLSFFEGYGNDERVLEWPGLGIPSAALQRYPFAQYHTSLDVPELLDWRLMEQATATGYTFLRILEENLVPRYTLKLQPWLTRRGLYFDSTTQKDLHHKLNNLTMFHVDGKRSILQLARIAGASFADVKDHLDRLAAQGVIAYGSTVAGDLEAP